VKLISQKDLKNESEKARRRSLEILRKLSVDEKLTILGEMMDAIAKIKISMLMKAIGCNEEEAIKILRERLMKLQETNR